MPDNCLPDDTPEIGFITIQLGLEESGIVPVYNYDGVTPEAAIGYLTAFADMIREDLKGWHLVQMFEDDDEDEDFDATHE